MAQLTIVGTSHIAPESLVRVERTIAEKKPGIVAVELDRKRLYALEHPEHQGVRFSDVRRIGVKGYAFALLGSYVEKKLGSKVGITPGDEMLKAVNLARTSGSRVALIDQDIEVTLRRFSEAITWKEKWRFVVELVQGLVFKSGKTFDLAKIPEHELIDTLLIEVKERYPNVYLVLVHERNVYMAHKLTRLILSHPDETIVAVVGKGHEREIGRMVRSSVAQAMKNASA